MSRFIDSFLEFVLSFCVLISLITTVAVVILLGRESYTFFQEVPFWDFLFGTQWTPLLEPKSFGVLPLVMGTSLIVGGAALIALPMGLLVAIYLSEYASARVRSLMKPVLEVLAGIPTVVYGYFALTFITPILQGIYPETNIFNAASGAIVVGIMILPMVSSLCDDAFQAVPSGIREGGYALGANAFEVIAQVLIPAARSRIGAAVVLAFSRAVGETMAVTLAAGATPSMSPNPMGSIQTMTAYIVQVTLGDAPAGGIEYRSSFAVGALLFVMTLLMNIIGNRLIFRRGEAL